MTDAFARLTAALADRYRIEHELGAGGMATVFLAEDLKHDRQVAIKVLKPELAAVLGADRFIQEIKTTAALQHPNILPLFDSGAADGFLYYVMPYVEGESLRDRLNREKQLPVQEAVDLTSEVADALEYAHEHGVVHRDIKPENILLHARRPMVADFGIALAVSAAAGGRMTETGLSLGTPHYMSPEQATAEKDITGRSDIYSLAATLYEMLTGEPPHLGGSAQQIIMKIVTEEPAPVTKLRKSVPPNVAAAVGKALEKLPADRFATASDFAAALTATGGFAVREEPQAPTPYRRVALVAVGIAVVAAAVAAWGWLRGTAPVQHATWQYVTFGDSITPALDIPALALSPDGKSLVFRDDRRDGRLWIKRLDALDPVPLVGTEQATAPTFSPDGEWIAFEKVRGTVEKVRVSGGAPVVVATGAGRPVWLDDGSIIVQTAGGLRRVWPGGESRPISFQHARLPGNYFGLYMTALPGARGLLFSNCVSPCLTLHLHVLDLKTGRLKTLLDQTDIVEAWYLRGGYLLYVRRDGAVMAAPFDLKRLEVTGDPISLLDDVAVGNLYVTGLAWSPSGSLVYYRGGGTAADNRVFRVDRQGTATPIVDTAVYGRFSSVALSPDGRRFAAGNGPDIWAQDLQGGPLTRLTSRPGATRPAWSPDGHRIAFLRDSADGGDLFVVAADGRGSERAVAHFDHPLEEVVWSHDGRWLLVRTDAPQIVGVHLSGDTTPVLLVSHALNPSLSPDDRWLAYTSYESGMGQVYVQPFPDARGRHQQVSTAGGWDPLWSPTGREIFWLDFNSRLVAARVDTGAAFSVEKRVPLFDASTLLMNEQNRPFDVAPDGQSFLFIGSRRLQSLNHPPRIVWVDHWFSDVAAKLRL